MKKAFFIVFFIFLMGSKLVLAGASIERFSAKQRPGTGFFDIRYDIIAGADKLDVSLEIFDGQEPVSSQSATGDIGQNQPPGRNRHIEWDAVVDYGVGRISTNMTFLLTVKPLMPEGGDPHADDWEVVSDRWIRNYYKNGAVTMLDRELNLMWFYDAAANGTAPWRDAQGMVVRLNYAGYTDWQLPDKKRLADLFPFIQQFKDVQPERYWTNNPNYSYADSVNMLDGRLKYDYPSKSRWVWPCRVLSGEQETK